jgi:hypothetical protein
MQVVAVELTLVLDQLVVVLEAVDLGQDLMLQQILALVVAVEAKMVETLDQEMVQTD